MPCKPSRLALIVCAFACAGAAEASAELARGKLCMGCHAPDRKLVGPSFRDIAARYAGQADAAPRLVERILRGSRGQWGQVPMPASPKVSADEARQLAGWILSTRP